MIVAADNSAVPLVGRGFVVFKKSSSVLSPLWILIVVFIAFSAVSCGTDRAQTISPITTAEANGEADASADLEPTIEAPVAAISDGDRDAILAALLALEDMPTGWTQAEAADFSPSVPGGTYLSMCKEIPARSIGSASTSFSLSTLGPQLNQTVVVFPSRDEAVAALADLMSVAQECGEYSDDNGNVFTLSPLAFPSLGDDAFAVRSSNQLVQADWVQVRVDSTIINLIHAGLSIDSELTEELARLAVDKYEGR